jgi:hypothetical protein
MTARIVERLFWDRKLSSRQLRVWMFALLLAPLAFAGALYLHRLNLERFPQRGFIDRERALTLVREKAAAFGWY